MYSRSQYWVQSCSIPSLMIWMMVQGIPSGKFAVYTRLGEVADTPESHADIQRHPDRMKKWVDRNLMKFRKGKCKTLHLGRINPMHNCMLESQCYKGNIMQEIWKCLHVFSNHGNEILPGCHHKCFENVKKPASALVSRRWSSFMKTTSLCDTADGLEKDHTRNIWRRSAKYIINSKNQKRGS